MATERVVDGVDTGWITDPLREESLHTGLPAPWMPSCVRILHAAWESPGPSLGVSHHQVRAEALATGEIEPVHIGDVDMEVGILTGVSGRMETPPQGWRRLRWSEIAARIGVELDPTEASLEGQLLPFLTDRSWPSSVVPPPEGTLDELSLRVLADILQVLHRGLTIAYSTRDDWFGDGGFSRGTVREVWELSMERGYSPNNWWPDDRSWLVCTDYDSQATDFFGDAQVVEAVATVPELETLPGTGIRWPEAWA